MPRPRKDAPGPQLSSGQAAYVLERLIRDRRVSRTEIGQYITEMGREISDLEARLQRLREAAGTAIAAAAKGVAAVAAAGPAAIRRRRRGPGRPPGRPPGSAKAKAGGRKRGGKRGGKRSAGITAEQLASRQLQGRYLALVRQFPATKRAQFAKVAKEKGREAAIKDMQGALSK